MPVHHRQQQLIARTLPTDAAGGIDHPPRLVRRKILPPRNIRLFSATLTINGMREVEDLCGCHHRSTSNIPVSRKKAECLIGCNVSGSRSILVSAIACTPIAGGGQRRCRCSPGGAASPFKIVPQRQKSKQICRSQHTTARGAGASCNVPGSRLQPRSANGFLRPGRFAGRSQAYFCETDFRSGLGRAATPEA